MCASGTQCSYRAHGQSAEWAQQPAPVGGSPNNAALVLHPSPRSGKPANGDYRKDPRDRSRSPVERAAAPAMGLHGNHLYAHVPSLAMDQPLALTKNSMDAARTASISPALGPIERQQVTGPPPPRRRRGPPGQAAARVLEPAVLRNPQRWAGTAGLSLRAPVCFGSSKGGLAASCLELLKGGPHFDLI